jgi:hypothetical protein
VLESSYFTSVQSLYSEGHVFTPLSSLIQLFIRQTTEIPHCLEVRIIVFLNGPSPGNMVTCPYNISAGKIFYRLNGGFVSAKWRRCKSIPAVRQQFNVRGSISVTARPRTRAA